MKKYIKRGVIGTIVGIMLEIFYFNFAFFRTGLDFQFLNISISRIVAVVMITLVGTFLFNIQKMPDYHVNVKKTEADLNK